MKITNLAIASALKELRIVVILSFFISFTAFSQRELQLTDSLTANRRLFTTKVYRNTVELSNNRLTLLLQSSPKWSRKFTISKIIHPAGPIVAAGGVYLAYDAIKGVPMVANIDGVDYPYVVRSLPKLLGGIAFFVTGMSMVESANETKANAVKWYNGYLTKTIEDRNKTAFKARFGLQKSGRVGLALNF